MNGSRKTTEKARAAEWRALGARLELEDHSERASKLRGFLDLAPEVRLEPIFRLRLDIGGPAAALYLFDYQFDYQVSRSVPQLTSVALLNATHPVSPIALKALCKQHRVLENLTASASGSAIVALDDPGFRERVTVYARDASQARDLLTPPVRRILEKALYERGASPILLLGERQLLFSVTAPAAQPTPLSVLEKLTTDLLSLYAVLSARFFNAGSQASELG